MRSVTIRSALRVLCISLCVGSFQAAFPQQNPGKANPKYWVIEAVGTEKTVPNLYHLMMKMEYQAGLAADATAMGEKQLREFLRAVDDLKIPNLSYRVCNNVLTPAGQGEFPGIVYTRNVVFTLSDLAGQSTPERDRLIAKLEDLGARFNSHCVTCIGSG